MTAPRDIIARVARARGLKVEHVRHGGGRHRAHARPRHEAMWLLRRFTDLSLLDIGAALGGFDHTSVMYGIGKVWDACKADGAYQLELEALAKPAAVDLQLAAAVLDHARETYLAAVDRAARDMAKVAA